MTFSSSLFFYWDSVFFLVYLYCELSANHEYFSFSFQKIGKEELSLSWSSYLQLSAFHSCAKNCHLNSDASTNYHVHKEVKSTFPEDRMQSHSYFVSSFFLIIFIDRGKLNSWNSLEKKLYRSLVGLISKIYMELERFFHREMSFPVSTTKVYLC